MRIASVQRMAMGARAQFLMLYAEILAVLGPITRAAYSNGSIPFRGRGRALIVSLERAPIAVRVFPSESWLRAHLAKHDIKSSERNSELRLGLKSVTALVFHLFCSDKTTCVSLVPPLLLPLSLPSPRPDPCLPPQCLQSTPQTRNWKRPN